MDLEEARTLLRTSKVPGRIQEALDRFEAFNPIMHLEEFCEPMVHAFVTSNDDVRQRIAAIWEKYYIPHNYLPTIIAELQQHIADDSGADPGFLPFMENLVENLLPVGSVILEG